MYLTFSKKTVICNFHSGFFDKFIIVLSGQILVTMNPDTITPAEAIKKEELKEETRNISAALDNQHKKWFDNLPFFIISLIFATGTFIGGYFVRINVYFHYFHTNPWIYLGSFTNGFVVSMDVLSDSVIQTIIFVITVGFFVLPLSWLFNKFWQLFLKE